MIYSLWRFRPFWDKWHNRFEIFNEVAVLFVMANLLLFTYFVPNVFDRIDFGIYLMVVIMLVFFFDVIVLIYYSIKYSCLYALRYWKGQELVKVT